MGALGQPGGGWRPPHGPPAPAPTVNQNRLNGRLASPARRAAGAAAADEDEDEDDDEDEDESESEEDDDDDDDDDQAMAAAKRTLDALEFMRATGTAPPSY
jgi:hypothetical protein